jgi:hypothetical protein
MSATAWNETPWWEQRVLVEGLEQEELITLVESAAPGWEVDPITASDEDYRAMGWTVIDGG